MPFPAKPKCVGVCAHVVNLVRERERERERCSAILQKPSESEEIVLMKHVSSKTAQQEETICWKGLIFISQVLQKFQLGPRKKG